MLPIHNKNDNIFKYKLLLKQHYETGVNYLCVTTKDNYIQYKGSGLIWKKLLKKHKSNILTTLIFTSDDVEEFNVVCLQYSKLLNVSENLDFANLILETGYKKLCENPKRVDDETKRKNGKKGGIIAVKNNLGIFDPNNSQFKSEWASKGQQALKLSGNRSGFIKETDKNIIKQNASHGGKAGGKIVGKMFWWNNGKINKKSNFSPGENWTRGMLMSEKKKFQVYSKFAGHNKGKQNEK